MKLGDAITPKTDGYGKRKHFGCPSCGGVYLLPWSDSYDPPWCHHGGTTGYAWPETHWKGGVERGPDWRERWVENGWVEMFPITVTISHPCPKEDRCALNDGAALCKHCSRTWPPKGSA